MIGNLFAWSQNITSPLNHADHATMVWYSCTPVPLAICSTVRRSRPCIVFPLNLSLFLMERQTSPIHKIDFTQSTFSSHESGKVL